MRGVAGQQHPPLAVCGCLPGHVGEAGQRCWIVDTVIGAVDGDERLAEIAQRGLAASPDLALGHQHPHRPVFQPAEAVNADGVAMDAPLRLPG